MKSDGLGEGSKSVALLGEEQHFPSRERKREVTRREREKQDAEMASKNSSKQLKPCILKLRNIAHDLLHRCGIEGSLFIILLKDAWKLVAYTIV